MFFGKGEKEGLKREEAATRRDGHRVGELRRVGERSLLS